MKTELRFSSELLHGDGDRAVIFSMNSRVIHRIPFPARTYDACADVYVFELAQIAFANRLCLVFERLDLVG